MTPRSLINGGGTTYNYGGNAAAGALAGAFEGLGRGLENAQKHYIEKDLMKERHAMEKEIAARQNEFLKAMQGDRFSHETELAEKKHGANRDMQNDLLGFKKEVAQLEFDNAKAIQGLKGDQALTQIQYQLAGQSAQLAMQLNSDDVKTDKTLASKLKIKQLEIDTLLKQVTIEVNGRQNVAQIGATSNENVASTQAKTAVDVENIRGDTAKAVTGMEQEGQTSRLGATIAADFKRTMATLESAESINSTNGQVKLAVMGATIASQKDLATQEDQHELIKLEAELKAKRELGYAELGLNEKEIASRERIAEKEQEVAMAGIKAARDNTTIMVNDDGEYIRITQDGRSSPLLGEDGKPLRGGKGIPESVTKMADYWIERVKGINNALKDPALIGPERDSLVAEAKGIDNAMKVLLRPPAKTGGYQEPFPDATRDDAGSIQAGATTDNGEGSSLTKSIKKGASIATNPLNAIESQDVAPWLQSSISKWKEAWAGLQKYLEPPTAYGTISERSK